MNDKSKFCIALFALIIGLAAYSLAQTANDTANINNVFAIVVNNTDLYPAQRTINTVYWANDSPIAVYIIFHAVGSGAAQTFDSNFSVNNTIVLDKDFKTSAGAGVHDHWSFYTIVPKGANYSITNSTNVFSLEWREYPILSGKNGTLSVNVTNNISGNFVPYLGANQNITVGVNNFTIFSADTNSSLTLPNSSDNYISLIQKNYSGLNNTGSLVVNGGVELTVEDTARNLNSSYSLRDTSHAFKINNTNIALITRTGISTTSITTTTTTGVNNGNYPNATINETIIRNYTLHQKTGLFARDTTVASGTQAVTGLGFKPSSVTFFMAEKGTGEASWGTCTDGGSEVLYKLSGGANYWEASGSCIWDSQTDPTTLYTGVVSSFDSDGFTVTWTKTGLPTGTLTILYTAYR